MFPVRTIDVAALIQFEMNRFEKQLQNDFKKKLLTNSLILFMHIIYLFCIIKIIKNKLLLYIYSPFILGPKTL